MLSLTLLAAVLAQAPDEPPRSAAPVRQASATVRVLKGEAVRFAEIETDQPGALRDSLVRIADGEVQPARLLEFQ